MTVLLVILIVLVVFDLLAVAVGAGSADMLRDDRGAPDARRSV